MHDATTKVADKGCRYIVRKMLWKPVPLNGLSSEPLWPTNKRVTDSLTFSTDPILGTSVLDPLQGKSLQTKLVQYCYTYRCSQSLGFAWGYGATPIPRF